jgi:FKBP-type peptidyl-prolyl cis-trans isomerase SlyD
MSIRVGPGTRVTLAYTLKTDRGDALEERTPENPFIFEYGKGQTLPAIEAVIRGKTEGFEASLGVAAKEAYGEFDDELVASVALSTFPKPSDVQVGMKYSTRGPLGEELTVRVVEIDDENATVDGNHPLAGVDIEIDLRILEIEAIVGEHTNEVFTDDDTPTLEKLGVAIDDDDEPDDDPSGEGGSDPGRILH